MRTNEELADDLISLGQSLHKGWAPVSEEARRDSAILLFASADLLKALSPDPEGDA